MKLTTNKFNLVAVAVSAALLLTACDDGKDGAAGSNGTNGTNGSNGTNGQDLTAVAKLTRIATLPSGSEITGITKTDSGELFFNVQHPSDTLPAPENNAAIGAWVGVDFDRLDPRLVGVAVPASGSADALTTKVAAGTFQVLGRANDTYAGALPFGLGAVVNATNNAELKQSQDPDFNAFVPTNVDGSEGLLFVAWEDRPGSMNRLSLTRNTDKTWNVTNAINVDFSAVKGTIINCFGMVSPWGTPMTSEENYEAENSAKWNDATYSTGYPNAADVDLITQYLGGTFPNPYRYGYIVEITQPKTTPVPVKLFTLGRSAHENPVVMPDNKTVYLTDDGSKKGFYKFVADNANDLSVGTLYAAKVVQDATKDVTKAGFNISWIELGHASNAQIESWIAEYDSIDRSNFVAGSTSYITDAQITTWATGGAQDQRYPFIETLRASKAKGATVEFNKMEGIAINYNGAADRSIPFMYVAMSAVDGAMVDSSGDIQVGANKCGVVYRMGLHADYNVTRMEPVVAGGTYDAAAAGNRCPVGAIANPDNLVVLDDGRVLIGEDSSNHANNALWVYNPKGE